MNINVCSSCGEKDPECSECHKSFNESDSFYCIDCDYYILHFCLECLNKEYKSKINVKTVCDNCERNVILYSFKSPKKIETMSINFNNNKNYMICERCFILYLQEFDYDLYVEYKNIQHYLYICNNKLSDYYNKCYELNKIKKSFQGIYCINTEYYIDLINNNKK